MHPHPHPPKPHPVHHGALRVGFVGHAHSEAERIIRGMSDEELAMYLGGGGFLPPGLHGRAIEYIRRQAVPLALSAGKPFDAE